MWVALTAALGLGAPGQAGAARVSVGSGLSQALARARRERRSRRVMGKASRRRNRATVLSRRMERELGRLKALAKTTPRHIKPAFDRAARSAGRRRGAAFF